MNKSLTEEIIYHIFSNLGLLPSNFVKQEQTKSLLDKQFLLSEKLSFETDEKETVEKSLYACQVGVNNKALTLILADCTFEKDLPEYCLFVQLQDSPAFCSYLVFNGLTNETTDAEALIGVSSKNQGWIPCTMYLQATFLAGMEQLRDLNFPWGKCANYKTQVKQLSDFIRFHSQYFENGDE